MKKISAAIALAIAVSALSMSAHAKKTQVVRAPGGTSISPLGIAIDASYDPRLDTLAPGYKVINVALVNESFNVVFLNPDKDRWEIKLAGDGKTVTAIHDLRRKDPKAWSAIPERARGLMGYPLALPVGAREVVDIFVPDTVDVAQFNELDVYLRSADMKIEVLVRQ